MFTVEIREDSVRIDGYVNAVERESKVLRDAKGQFIEKIKAGAFQRAIERSRSRNVPVKVLLNHDYSRELTSTDSTETKLFEDNIGLRCQCVIRDAAVVRKAKQRKLNGWSFGFWPIVESRENVKGMDYREIREMELYEVSLLDDTRIPAYDGTSVEMRAAGNDYTEFRAFLDDIRYAGEIEGISGVDDAGRVSRGLDEAYGSGHLEGDSSRSGHSVRDGRPDGADRENGSGMSESSGHTEGMSRADKGGDKADEDKGKDAKSGGAANEAEGAKGDKKEPAESGGDDKESDSGSDKAGKTDEKGLNGRAGLKEKEANESEGDRNPEDDEGKDNADGANVTDGPDEGAGGDKEKRPDKDSGAAGKKPTRDSGTGEMGQEVQRSNTAGDDPKESCDGAALFTYELRFNATRMA